MPECINIFQVNYHHTAQLFTGLSPTPWSGHGDAGPQRPESDAVRQGNCQGGRSSVHQDPHGRRVHPPLGAQDPLVPVEGGASTGSGDTFSSATHSKAKHTPGVEVAPCVFYREQTCVSSESRLPVTPSLSSLRSGPRPPGSGRSRVSGCVQFCCSVSFGRSETVLNIYFWYVVLREFIQMPSIYFLHDIFFYFLNKDNKRIISRRVFTFLIDFFVCLFHFFVYCIYGDYFVINTQIYELFTDTKVWCLLSSCLLFFFQTAMFLTENLLLLGVSHHHCDVVTFILEKLKRSLRLNVSQTFDTNWIIEWDFTG